MLGKGRPLTLRQITNLCPMTYYQVASVLVALTGKGYVKRIRVGLYDVTEDAHLLELSPEAQIVALKKRIVELETLIKRLLK